MIRSVLVVCVGNLCRSPMAEGLLRTLLPGIDIGSAGLQAELGQAPAPQAVAVMREHAIDISRQRSQPLTRHVCARYDLILTMDQGLRERILVRYPQLRGKVHTLTGAPIPDPYRQSDEAFADCYERIASAMSAWVPRLSMLCGPLTRARS